jgi:hypothetical protein
LMFTLGGKITAAQRAAKDRFDAATAS